MKILILFFLMAPFASAQSVSELEQRINALAEEIETLKLGRTSSSESVHGLGQSASKVYGNVEGATSIGGYGEIVLNSPKSENESGAVQSNNAEAEVLRNIIYIGHKFNSQWILNTEIEIEHVDEVFVEFAFLDYLHSEALNFRTGLVLIPMGLVNELHEPIYFLSVNRPEVEQYIIPSTWRELGAGIHGQSGKFTYRAYLINGLDASGFSSSGLRGGRKKGGVKENASSMAVTGRLDYQLTDNFSLGTALYSGSSSSSPTSPTVGTSLYQAHFEWKQNNFMLKGMYVLAQLDDVNQFNTQTGGSLAEEMEGYYFDAGYSFWFGKAALTPFIRYEAYDTQKEVVNSITKDLSKERTNIVAGVTFRPIEKIIFKLDYTQKENEAKTGIDEYNLSIGYLF